MLNKDDRKTSQCRSLLRRLVFASARRRMLPDRRRFIGMTLATAGGGLAIATLDACTPMKGHQKDAAMSDTGLTLLTDKDIARYGDMRRAMLAVEKVLAARIANEMVAPPRHAVQFADRGSLVFTVGGAAGEHAVAGFRVYDTFRAQDARRTQIVVVWDSITAELRGIVSGELLGQVRTGAIGGVAIQLMSRNDANVVGVIGSGAQARTQLEAAAVARKLTETRVYSRSADNRARFAADMSKRLGITVRPVETGREAVQGAHIVLLATSSESPVVEAAWLEPGAHINTVGPKLRGSQELGVDVAEAADLIATDSPEQARSYRPPFFLDETPHMDRMRDLADVWKQRNVAQRAPNAITLFCSVGLAGTEVFVADEIIARVQGRVSA